MWKYKHTNSTTGDIIEADGTYVATIQVLVNSTAHSNLERNLRLMAAAPELLDTLELLLKQDEQGEDEIWLRNKARSLIRRCKS